MNMMVSVLCLAYNHENYIRECLDGILKQKTNFEFEVLINDDASTDHTASILREYEQKYPNIIKPIYQTENQYSKGIKITDSILLPKAQGKYIALCEGDDFWIDEYKLQTQVDAMESNPNCFMCVHKVQMIYKTGEQRKGQFPNSHINTGILDREYLLKDYNFQTSCFFFRTVSYREYSHKTLPYRQICSVGDLPCLLYFSDLGNVYYIDKVMSCYRTNSIGSYNDRLDPEKRTKNLKNMIETLNIYDEYTCYKYHDIIAQRIKKEQYLIAIENKNLHEIFRKENRAFLKQRKAQIGKRFFPKTMMFYWQLKRYISKFIAK